MTRTPAFAIAELSWHPMKLPAFFLHLDGRIIVDSGNVASSPQKRVVLDLFGMHQHLIAVSIVTILPGNHPLAVLVHMKDVRVDRDTLNLP